MLGLFHPRHLLLRSRYPPCLSGVKQARSREVWRSGRKWPSEGSRLLSRYLWGRWLTQRGAELPPGAAVRAAAWVWPRASPIGCSRRREPTRGVAAGCTRTRARARARTRARTRAWAAAGFRVGSAPLPREACDEALQRVLTVFTRHR